jgi:hypothetical protein
VLVTHGAGQFRRFAILAAGVVKTGYDVQLMQCVTSLGSSLHIYESETNLDGRHGRAQIYMTKNPYRYRRGSRDLERVQYRSL